MVIIILGSKSDLDWGNEIAKNLEIFNITFKIHIASAHKTPEHLLSLIRRYESSDKNLVFICVAGRSNALGGFVDAQTIHSVINCPPYNEKYCGLDILSSLRMPSGVAPLTVLEPEQAALAAAKILALEDKDLRKKIADYQKQTKNRVIEENKKIGATVSKA